MPENSNCSGASSCSKESCEGCPSNAKNKAGGGIAKEPMNAASNVKKVIGVVSGKGGVGKSFVTASLAAAMNRAGYKVGIMDADITGPSIPKMFGIHGQVYGTDDGMVPMETENGIKIMSINLLLDDEEAPVIWRGPVIAGVVKQFWNETVWGDVDYLFVDMPPGTGVPVASGRRNRDCDVPAGTRADDREKGVQHGGDDACAGARSGGEFQLPEMSRLRKRDQAVWRESYRRCRKRARYSGIRKASA